MPLGKTHGRATRVLMFFTVIIGGPATLYISGEQWEDLIPLGWILLGEGTGLFVDPDLDMKRRTASENRMRKALVWTGEKVYKAGGCFKIPGMILTVVGEALMAMWLAYWMPYFKVMPHRGESHLLVVGTLVRAVYLLWPLFLVCVVRCIFTDWAPPKWLWSALFFWFVGLALSDALHIVMDWADKWRKGT